MGCVLFDCGKLIKFMALDIVTKKILYIILTLVARLKSAGDICKNKTGFCNQIIIVEYCKYSMSHTTNMIV